MKDFSKEEVDKEINNIIFAETYSELEREEILFIRDRMFDVLVESEVPEEEINDTELTLYAMVMWHTGLVEI